MHLFQEANNQSIAAAFVERLYQLNDQRKKSVRAPVSKDDDKVTLSDQEESDSDISPSFCQFASSLTSNPVAKSLSFGSDADSISVDLQASTVLASPASNSVNPSASPSASGPASSNAACSTEEPSVTKMSSAQYIVRENYRSKFIKNGQFTVSGYSFPELTESFKKLSQENISSDILKGLDISDMFQKMAKKIWESIKPAYPRSVPSYVLADLCSIFTREYAIAQTNYSRRLDMEPSGIDASLVDIGVSIHIAEVVYFLIMNWLFSRNICVSNWTISRKVLLTI